MRQRARRTVVAAAVLALVATSCGNDDAEPAAEDVGEVPADATGSGEGSSGLGLSADDPTVIRAGELAVVLVGELGDDETASGALLLAGDAGYDGRQIEAAIVAGNLAADGSIAGVDPNLAAYGKVAGFRAAQEEEEEEEPLPIDALRREAVEEAGQEDYWPEGALATSLILQWQLSGYSQEQIVEMLILGVATLDDSYKGDIAEGEEECGGYVIGGVHEVPKFCDPETGELFADRDEDEPATTDAPVAEPAEPAEAGGLCGDDFAPPYSDVVIQPSGVMLETEILGPLETPYYYTEVGGFLDIAADGSVTLMANTVRYADIVIRDAPDNQIYIREFEVSGSIDAATGDGELTGTANGTDQLWSGDSQNPAGGDVAGPIGLVCDDDGVTIFGYVSGPGGVLEFEASQ